MTQRAKGVALGARIDPFAYGVDGLRAVLTGTSAPLGLTLDLLILSVLVSGLILWGSYLFSRIEL